MISKLLEFVLVATCAYLAGCNLSDRLSRRLRRKDYLHPIFAESTIVAVVEPDEGPPQMRGVVTFEDKAVLIQMLRKGRLRVHTVFVAPTWNVSVNTPIDPAPTSKVLPFPH
jgi:hypothetical protein